MNSTAEARKPQAKLGDLVTEFGKKARPELRAAKANAEFGSVSAVSFLEAFDADGWHNLVALDPSHDHGAPVDARTFAPGEFDAIAKWVDERDGRFNLYFTANEPKPGSRNKKLSKDDIGAIRAVYADIDLPAGVSVDTGLIDLQKSVAALELGAVPPTFRIDSGGGLQLFWRLDRKYDPEQFRDWAEGQGRALAALVEGDAVQNIDRLMRLPGTLNVPTPAKVAKGRVKRRSSVIANYPDRTYSSAQLSSAFPPISAPTSTTDIAGEVAATFETIDMGEVESCDSYDELPADLRERLEAALRDRRKLSALWHGDASALLGADRTSSAWRAALAAHLSAVEGFDAQDYANLVWVWDQADRAKIDLRQLARDWAKYGAPNVAKREKLLDYHVSLDDEQERPDRALFGSPVSDDVFRTLTLGDLLTMPDPVFVIDRHIPEQSLGFLYGEPGAKKSFVALDWALHLAYGRDDWHGDAIRTKAEGVVLYLAGEGAAGMKKRARAWLRHMGIDEKDPRQARFRLLPHAVNLMRPDEVAKLARTLRKAIAAPVAAVIVDTVSRAVAGADENLQKEMTLFVKSCDTIKRQFECVVLGVHHASRNGNMRGSTVLQGAGDFVFRLECRKGALAGRLHCEKQKDAPDGWSEPYRFEVVHFGDGASSLVPARVRGGGSSEFTPELEKQILDAIAADWAAGKPWAKAKQSTDRWAPRRLHLDFGLAIDEAERIIDLLISAKSIELAVVDRKTKRQGFRVVDDSDANAERASGVFG
ncbi:AAA family ATPase [Mesorhizobium marinum]|uniref:AAA family ATPase n=1 Tax=Mesorhizobium marinum TaxID=3228790 RepID=UPI00346745A2